MSKVRVPIANTPTKVVTIESDATIGAIFGVNLRYPNGTLVQASDFGAPPTNGGGTQPVVTIWQLILEIPPNVTALAETATTGLYVVTGPGTSVTRGILPGPGIDVTFSNGVAGDPTIAHGDTSSVTDITATFTGGTVPDQIILTFDTFGHVLTRTITGRTLDHNDTGALQGGNATERYHFTAAEHTGLLPWAAEAPGDYLQDAPSDGTTYGREDGAWVPVGGALKFPFILQTGASPISLTTDEALPFFLADGSPSNIPVIT